ncbi:hypothetical protein EDB92DRAFT_1948027 [Lactarius akahatsu]|uniref:DUF6534 domain-containing protein n=1 Tax=Lactarius akahatsu TaxID=416441 RepID=A0AAD4LE14_9AGAM|nr:hypothetical protein EDB92DRAFT_1948027 [Lactarius akahatsu]
MSAPPPGPPPVLPNIAEITAPLLLGSVWNWTLYGVLITQFYVYTYNFPNDNKRFKFLAYGMFLLETVQSGLALADLYYWFASGFGDITHLASPHLSVWDGPLLGGVASLTVQFFFVYRIWVLSSRESWWLCLLISLCSTVAASSEISGGIYSHVSKGFTRGRVLKIFSLASHYIWLIGSVLADGLIAVSMLYHLEKRRIDGGGFFGNHAMSRIVRLTVETNLLTTAVTIIALVLIVVKPDKDWYTCPTAIMGKLYSNALLASLNNRIAIREGPERRAAIRSPSESATLSSATRSKGTSDFIHFQLEMPPPPLRLMPSRDSVGRSRSGEGEGREGIFDLA